MIFRTIAVVVGSIVLAAGVALRLRAWWSGAAQQGRRMYDSYVPNAGNDTTLSVRGWSESELAKILRDFQKSYDLPASAMSVRREREGVLVVTFPKDVEPRLLYFLVNYVMYPKEFDERPIAALCRTTVTEAFGPADSAQVGKHATVYVPADDTEYDEVYIRIEGGAAFQIPFTTLVWHPAASARVPANVADL